MLYISTIMNYLHFRIYQYNLRRHIPSFSSDPSGHWLQLNSFPVDSSTSGVTSVQFVPSVQGLSWQPS